MSAKSDKKSSLASKAPRVLPEAARNSSLSWTDIFKSAQETNSNITFEEAPAEISCETNAATEPLDRSKSLAGSSAKKVNSPRAAEPSPEHSTASKAKVISFKVDTWREKSPKTKRKEWEYQQPAQKPTDSAVMPPTKNSSVEQRQFSILKDQDASLSFSDFSPSAKSSEATSSPTMEKDFGRPPSPSLLKRIEILPKVDTWRGDRSPTIRRQKISQEQGGLVDASVSASTATEVEKENSIGTQACSLDFLVSVGAEVKVEAPLSPSPKKIVMPKVDTRWKDGVPKRPSEFTPGRKNVQMDTDYSISPTADHKFVYAMREQKPPSDCLEENHPNILADTLTSTRTACDQIVDSSASAPAYVLKLKSSFKESGAQAEKHSLAPLIISQNSPRSESYNGSRPASPVFRKRQPDSAIVTTPTSTSQREASVAEVDQYLASTSINSPKQSVQSQRIKAAALTAGKHIAEYENLIRECEDLADEKAGLTNDRQAGTASLPYHITLPRNFSNIFYSTKVPMVILLVYVLMVLQLLTGESTLRYRQNCHQVEFRYSNSGDVYCQN